jgi:hypothetical protein
LIDADALIKEYRTSNIVHHYGEQIVNKVNARPTVEAIPKADYETRLKADMVAMLEEIRQEIEELKDEPACCQHFVRGIRRSSEVIQQKINALNGE